MKNKDIIGIEYVQQFLHYNPNTGVFVWKSRDESLFGPGYHSAHTRCLQWNARCAGKVAGGIDDNGYVRIRLAGKRVRAHQLAWLTVNGSWPDQIDHIDGNRSNNSIDNLRLATYAQNSQNRARRRTNKSGFTGVYWDRETKKWRAEICHKGVDISLGRFIDKYAAYAAYLAAKAKYHTFQPVPREANVGP